MAIFRLFLSKGDRDHSLGLSFCYANEVVNDSGESVPLQGKRCAPVGENIYPYRGNIREVFFWIA